MPVDDEFRAGMARARKRYEELSEIMPMDVTVEEAANALMTYLIGGDKDCAYDALTILRFLQARMEQANDAVE
jgi:hypothetical protein